MDIAIVTEARYLHIEATVDCSRMSAQGGMPSVIRQQAMEEFGFS